jgi:curved DNA-binding protein
MLIKKYTYKINNKFFHNEKINLLFIQKKFIVDFDITKDYYKILGLNKTATEKEIKIAYYKMAKMHHPDLNGGKQSIEFKEMTNAYDILSDSTKKKDYDSLRNTHNSSNSYSSDYTEYYRNRNRNKNNSSNNKSQYNGSYSQYDYNQYNDYNNNNNEKDDFNFEAFKNKFKSRDTRYQYEYRDPKTGRWRNYSESEDYDPNSRFRYNKTNTNTDNPFEYNRDNINKNKNPFGGNNGKGYYDYNYNHHPMALFYMIRRVFIFVTFFWLFSSLFKKRRIGNEFKYNSDSPHDYNTPYNPYPTNNYNYYHPRNRNVELDESDYNPNLIRVKANDYDPFDPKAIISIKK